MILVTGATGNVGAELVKQLATKGHKVRALVRSPSEASGKFATTVDLAAGDFDNPDSLVAAMRGVERVYALVPFTPALVAQDKNLIEAAKRAGVKHVVKHSVLGAQYEGVTLGKWHRVGEKLLEASGLAWTHLRPGGFASNARMWAETIKTQGKVYQPTGDGKLGVIDPRDIASAAAVVLTTPGHESKTYDLTGPEALTTGDMATTIGKVIGKPVTYVDVPDSAARESMLGMGLPALIADALLEFTGMMRAGQAGMVSDAVKQLTGTNRTFETWVRDNAAAFR
jgi:uncharacterized protein YbjT (DUF2867 family)